MNVEVLVATMNQADHSLLKKMNIQSDAIVGNQCNRNEIEEFNYNGHRIKYLSFAEKGVGLNRNNTLMRATGEICIIADDDIVFNDGYIEMIKKSFIENPSADVIIFNLFEKKKSRYVIKEKFNVGYHNFMRFGATRIAFKRKSVVKYGISFNLMFGGGARFSAGEDTLFLLDCLRHKLKIIAVPEYIAELTESRDSSWFKGYTEKYFIDRGALFASISNRWAYLLCLQFVIRHHKRFSKNQTRKAALNLMRKGIKKYKNLNKLTIE